ncbi:MAG: hypothetical protein JW996_01305, partial [Candidatus Cloacimonetes bacterium]|nr:hypothetical protein [Candidatus Cloacimonadota bacterium]
TTAVIAAPSNFHIGITDSGQTELTWNNLGLFYRIYKSPDPYADFPDEWILLDSLLAQGVFIDTVISSKSFYRITAGTIPEHQEN